MQGNDVSSQKTNYYATLTTLQDEKSNSDALTLQDTHSTHIHITAQRISSATFYPTCQALSVIRCNGGAAIVSPEQNNHH